MKTTMNHPLDSTPRTSFADSLTPSTRRAGRDPAASATTLVALVGAVLVAASAAAESGILGGGSDGACPRCKEGVCYQEVVTYRCKQTPDQKPIKKTVYECREVPYCQHKLPGLFHGECCPECEACPKFKKVLVKKEIVVGETSGTKCVPEKFVERLPVPCCRCGYSPPGAVTSPAPNTSPKSESTVGPANGPVTKPSEEPTPAARGKGENPTTNRILEAAKKEQLATHVEDSEPRRMAQSTNSWAEQAAIRPAGGIERLPITEYPADQTPSTSVRSAVKTSPTSARRLWLSAQTDASPQQVIRPVQTPPLQMERLPATEVSRERTVRRSIRDAAAPEGVQPIEGRLIRLTSPNDERP